MHEEWADPAQTFACKRSSSGVVPLDLRNRTGNPLVQINPAQLHLAKGPRQDVKTATAHELYRHGLGIIHKAFDPGTLGGTNSYAIQQENIARKWYSRKAPGSYPPADRHY